MKHVQERIRNGVDSHNHAMSIPIAQVVKELVEFLGAPTVAAIGGVKETRAVQQWAEDREPQRPHVLRFALQLASMIAMTGQRAMAQAWFNGGNPGLGGESPLVLIRTRPLDEIQSALLTSAQTFAARLSEESAER